MSIDMKYLINRLCIPVKGFNRSIIYDLGRKDYFFIPNELFEVINTLEVISGNRLQAEEEWYHFLLDNEIIFELEEEREANDFPSLPLHYEVPYDILSLVIHDNFFEENIKVFSEYSILNLSILIDKDFKFEELFSLIKLTVLNLDVESIDLFISGINHSEIIENLGILNKVSEVFSVWLFNNSSFEKENRFNSIDIFKAKGSLSEYLKSMKPEKLRVNNSHFREASNYHNYYYKKIYVDKMGHIKNGVNDLIDYGTIKSIKRNKGFAKLYQSQEFRKFWLYTKDSTPICKDCEFRFMCVDSRAIIYQSDLSYRYDYECSYNPYISLWDYETGYLNLKSSGIDIKSNGSVIIDLVKLAVVNEKNWS